MLHILDHYCEFLCKKYSTKYLLYLQWGYILSVLFHIKYEQDDALTILRITREAL